MARLSKHRIQVRPAYLYLFLVRYNYYRLKENCRVLHYTTMNKYYSLATNDNIVFTCV